MTDKSVNIIWRKNNSYDDINSLLSIVNYSGKINIYNFTDDELPDLLDENDRIIKEINVDDNEYVNNLIKNVLDETKNDINNIFFIDSCILYDDIIDLNIDIKSTRQYAQINNKKNSLYLDLGYKTKDININKLEEIQFLEDEIDILVNGTFDENYLDNYYDLNINSSRGVKLLLIEYMLGKYIVDIDRHIPKNTLEIHYLGIIKYLKTNEIKYLTNCFKVNQITYESLDYLLSIDDKDQKKGVIIKIFENIPKRSIFRIRNLDKSSIEKKVIDILVNYKTSRFSISDIPTWINKDNIIDICKYYPKLINGTSSHNGKLDLTKNIVLINNKYNINENVLEIIDEGFILDGNNFESKLYTFLYFNNKHTLFMTNNNPVEFAIIKDNKLTSIFKYENNILDNLKLVGPIVPFFNRYIGLVQKNEKLFKLVIFEKSNLKVIALSKAFQVESNDIISIRVKDNNLFIIGKKNDGLEIFSIDHVKLFTDICSDIDIDDIFTLEIKDRNNIILKIDGYNNIIDTYEGYVFNRDEEVLHTIEYNLNNRLFNFNNTRIYHKNFIYLPQNIDKKKKEKEIYFHPKSDCGELKQKCTDMGISIGDSFENCKYYVIEHKYLEKLNSLQLSNIIENSCLIVSLIENSDINSSNFKKIYTSDENITKLFLFNIAKNDSYIQFIFDKIIHNDQYNARKQYMEIDKTRIYDETNIYKTIIEFKDDGKNVNNVSLSEKGVVIWNNIKQSDIFKKYKYDKDLEFLTKYIIKNNFNLNVCINSSNSEIKTIVDKVNFIGNNIDNDTDLINISKYDMVISDSTCILDHIDSMTSPTKIYILDGKMMISI